MRKRYVYIIVSLLIMAVGAFLPGIGAVSRQGVAAIALIAAMIVLIATAALPLGVIAFLCILAQPLMGVTSSLAETTSYWASYLFFFVILAYAIGLAFSHTHIPRRVLFFMLNHAKHDAYGPILAIWLTTALLSGIIANFAIVALMLAFCWEYLSLFEDEEEKRRTARCLLIGLCCSTELGGNITPLGSSINVMVINFMEENGHSLSYATWIMLSAPLFAALFFLMQKILFALLKPCALSEKRIEECIEQNKVAEPLSAEEKRLLLIVAVMMGLLLLNPLFATIKSELVIVAAGIILMFPGIGVIHYDELAKSTAFTSTTYMCCFIGLAGVLSDAGVVQLIVDELQRVLPETPSVFVVVALVCVISIALCNFLPAASVPSVLTVPMILFADASGIAPALVVIPLAMCSNCSWILPLDPIALLTYEKGYYKLADMVVPGLILTAVTAAVTGLWMTLVSFAL